MKNKVARRHDLQNMYYTILAYTPFRNKVGLVFQRNLQIDLENETIHHERRKGGGSPDYLRNPLMEVFKPDYPQGSDHLCVGVAVTYVNKYGHLLWQGVFNWTDRTWVRWQYYRYTPYYSPHAPPPSNSWVNDVGHSYQARMSHDGFGASLLPRSDKFVVCYDGIQSDGMMGMLLAQIGSPCDATLGSKVLENMGAHCPRVVRKRKPGESQQAFNNSTAFEKLRHRCMWTNWAYDLNKRMTLAPTSFEYRDDADPIPRPTGVTMSDARSKARLVAVADVIEQYKLPRFTAGHPQRTGSETMGEWNSPMQEVFYLENASYAEYGRLDGVKLTAIDRLAIACDELHRLSSRSRPASDNLMHPARQAVIEGLSQVERWEIEALTVKYAKNKELIDTLYTYGLGGQYAEV